jgi:hypothetical protein
MKRVVTLALLVVSALCFAASDAPLKVSVRELLAHADKYDKQHVEVTGYYDAGMEDSYLYVNRAACCDIEKAIYIDPSIWDPRLHPRKPKNLLDAQRLKSRVVRVVGTFRSHPLPPSVVTNGGEHGPTITDVSYFRPIR